MKTDLAADTAVSVTETGANTPEINWGKYMPQLFTRKGKVRPPHKWSKVKRSFADSMRKLDVIKTGYNFTKDLGGLPELQFIAPFCIITLSGETLKQFMEKNENNISDFIGAGWECFMV